MLVLSRLFCVSCLILQVGAFLNIAPRTCSTVRPRRAHSLLLSSKQDVEKNPDLSLDSKSDSKEFPKIPLDSLVQKEKEDLPTAAATKTVNERLMAELEDASNKEKFGARSSMGKKMGLSAFRSDKTDEEREAAIEEARNLNGVNPIVAIGGSMFALACAAGLWYLTNFLAAYFAMHPPESDVYFVQRVTAVFRNVVMGLSSLASGFFGVTGVGIFLLGLRVAYGVTTGELDPTPIKSRKREEIEEMPNVWDLMMGKNQGRGRR